MTIGNTPNNNRKKVIIDTDVDINGWMAMLYLLNHAEIEVVGITTVGTGACHIESATQNALNLMQFAGDATLPVAIGLDKPMAYEHRLSESVGDSLDNVFGITLPTNPNPAVGNALDFLAGQIVDTQEKITLLAIGPLTNIGTLLQQNPELAQQIERIVVMGGAIDAPGNVNAVDGSIANVVAEWNIYCDPVAADIVFRSGVPITLVPLDATQHAPVTQNFYSRLLQHHITPASTLVYQALTENYALLASGECDFCDPLAAAILTDSYLGTYRELSLSVVTENNDRSGQLILDDNATALTVCFDVTAAAFEDLFLATLNGEPSPRKEITFLLDGDRVTLSDVSPQSRLIDYLHQPDIGKSGTKLVCSQGGCGACTVMLTHYDVGEKAITNNAINACLRPLASIDGCMVTTTQGIGNIKDGVDEVQYQLAANNGSQCGFCSPGFTMNMFTLRQNKHHNGVREKITEKEVEDLFDGNICRCTGYRPILEGFKQFADDYKPPHPKPAIKIDPNFKPAKIKPFEKILPPDDFIGYMKQPAPLSISHQGYTYVRPVTLAGLYKQKMANGPTGDKFRLLCGNTSIGIYPTKAIYGEAALDPHYLVDISVIPELQQVHVDDQGITVGGAITLSRLLAVLDSAIDQLDKTCTRGFVALREHLLVVANLQVRNEGSLSGNVHIATNQGFLSDVVLMLGTLGGTVKVSWANGSQEYDILDLPKESQLEKDAIYESFFIPCTEPNTYVNSYKIRRRNEDSHALVNAGFSVTFEDHSCSNASGSTSGSTSGKDRTVKSCRIVYNGVNADYRLASTTYGLQFHPITVDATRQLLVGREWNEHTLRDVLTSLEKEVAVYQPPSNDQGQPYEIGQIPFSYRASLVETLFYKFFIKVADEISPDDVQRENRSAGESYHRPLSSGRQYYNSYPEELPVSDPYIKLSAFMQTTGEARYTQDVERPPSTLEAAYVYSQVAFGQFYYQLPKTTAHGIKGERIDVAKLTAFLSDRHPDFVALITYDDIPEKTRNWTGLGGDDPIFVPSLDQQLPEGIEPNDYFYPHHVTCVGAPIALVVAKSQLVAQEIGNFVRSQCICFEEQPGVTFDEAIEQKLYYPQSPPTDPSLTHLAEIVRPGSNTEWLASPAEEPFREGDKTLPVVSGGCSTGYQNHFYLETMNTLAVPGENRSITLHVASQDIADNQYVAAGVLGVPAANVQVKLTRLGGGFGGRQSRSRFNSTASAVAAWVLNQPVRLVLDRNTNFITCGERHAYRSQYSAAYDQDGTIKGFAIDLTSDGGNTYDLSFAIMDMSVQSNDNAYNIESYRVGGKVCQTNKLSNTAFRTFGLVQAINLSEQAIEHVAYKLGKTPEEIREKNMYKDGDDEWRGFTITDQTLGTLQRLEYNDSALEALLPIKDQHFEDEKSFERAIEKNDPSGIFSGGADLVSLKEYSTTSYDFTPYMEGLKYSKLQELWFALKRDANFDERVEKVNKYNAENRWRKRGISMIPLKYGISYSGPRGTLNQGGAYVLAYSDDGSVLVSHGGVEMGQGIQTKMAQIAAETLGIDIEHIKMSDTDTNVISDASATAASTGSDLNGGAVQLACQKLRKRLEKFCENLEQYTVYFSKFDKTKMDAGIVSQMETVTRNWRDHWSEVWPDICALAYVNRVGLTAEARYKTPNYSGVDLHHSIGNIFFYYTFAVAVSEVEIDVLTGDFTVLRSDILFDLGKSLNPLIDIGQIEGGFVQGIGYLTTEEMTYQGANQAPRAGYPDGALTSTNTWEYKPPGTKSIPLDLRVRIHDNSDSKLQQKGPKLDGAAVKSSKGIGEPPLVLGNTVFFAIKQAIQAFYKDQGHDSWVEMNAPATVENIQSTCRVAIDELKL